ncbi:MAG: DUF4175 family protein [Nitrospinota bacterium]
MTGKRTPSRPSPLDSIRLFLRSAEVRLRMWGLLEMALWVATVGCVVVLLGIGARAIREFWPFSPPVYAGLAAALGIWALAMLIWKGVRRIPADRVAFLIEQRHPEFKNALISSVQLTSQPVREGLPSAVSHSLLGALLKRTADAIGPVDPSDAIDRSRLWWPLRAAGVSAALTLIVGLIGPGALAGSWDLLLHPIERMPLRAILIQTKPLSGKILLGQPVKLQAVTSGRRVKKLWVEIRPEEAEARVVELTPEGEGPKGEKLFSHATGPVRASFSYRAFMGSDSSETQRLEAVPPPAVGEIEIGYTYPYYAGLKREVRKGSGYVRALKGTEVALSLQTNKPLGSGRLAFQSGVEVPLDLSDPQRPRGRFILMDKDAYRILLRDRWGFENPAPVRYSVDVVPDQPPAVELLQPQGELTVNGGETLTVGYQARDDFGLNDVRLVAEVSGAGRREFRVAKLDGAKRWDSGRYDWDLGDLRLQPGAVVRARLVVRDNDAISGPKEGVSKTIRIRVRNPEEEHKRVKNLQKDVSDRLLDLLADQLDLEADASEKVGESPDGLPLEKTGKDARASRERGQPAQETPRYTREDADALRQSALQVEEKVRELISQIDRALSRVARDRRSGYDSFADLNALRSNLSYLQREMMPQARRPLESWLEAQDQEPGSSNPESLPGAPPNPRGTQSKDSEFRAHARFQKSQKEVTRELERMAVFSDDIGKRGQLRDLANLGRRLANAQNRLLDAFDRAKQGDKAGQQALREALAKLRDLLNKLAQGLRNLPVQLPEEFLNMPTSRMLQMDDLSKKLQEIQRRLEAGDLEGARKLTEELVKSLSQMIAALSGAFQQAMNQGSNQFANSAQRQQSILQQLLNRQRALLEATRKIEEPMKSEFRERQAEAYRRAEEMGRDALSRLRGLAQEFPNPTVIPRLLEEDANSLERSIAQRSVPQAEKEAAGLRGLSRELAEILSEQSEGGEEADKDASLAYGKLAEDFAGLASALKSLPNDPRIVLTPAQRSRLAELKKEQKEVEGKTVEVRKRVERIMRLVPFLSPEIAKNLREAGDAMGQATGELGEQRADRAVPHQRDAIYWLSRAGSNMRNAMQQMARRGRFGGASAPSVVQPGGVPSLALQWRPDVGEEEGGRIGASTRDFRLPGKDAYKVPKVYREEVVEALKGKYPPEYREQIEQYFKNLVE